MSFLDPYFEKIEGLGPVIAKAGDRADQYACRIIELLESIDRATGNLYGVDVYEYPPLPFDAAGVKTVEGREGYVKVIKSIAVVAPAAANVDLYVGADAPGGFVWREAVAAAGQQSKALEIPAPEAAPIYVRASAAAQVNLIIQRIKL